MENSRSSTVLICGAGPTGMTAALELSRLQIPVRLIDKMSEPATTSRATCVQPRTLELFQQRGLAESMLQKGIKAFATNIHGQGKRVARADYSHNGSDYPYTLCISQSDTEAVLRSALEKQGVTIERCVEFIAISQSDADRSDHVKAILKHRNGSLEEFDCAYLISTEGAHSIARTTMNLNFTGKTREEIFITVDVVVEGELSTNELHVFASEQGMVGAIPLGEGNRFRVFAANPLNTPAKDKMPSLEEIQKIFDMRSYVSVRFSNMTESSWFRINCRMINRLRVGRVFLGGDSAHVHSPMGGQGMNACIQDIINLAWKLAFVMKGKADPKLLDTYSDERIPVIRDIVTQTDGMTDVVGNQSLLFRSAFDLIVPWVAGIEFVQKTLTKREGQLAIHYRNSAISVSHNAGGKLRGGDRIPNLKVQIVGGEGEGMPVESLFHFLNIDLFTLLFANLTEAEATHQSAELSLASWKGLIQSYTIAPAPGQELTFQSVIGSQSTVILVRPDGYVAFVGTENSLEGLVKYLNSWFPTHQNQTNDRANMHYDVSK